MNKAGKIISFLIVLVFGFLLLFYSAKNDSLTTDEGVHLGAGYTYLINRDFRFDPEHPILIKELAAAPLLFMKISQPSDYVTLWDKGSNFFYDSWQESRAYGEQLIFASHNDFSGIIFWSQLVMILITLGAATFVFYWSKKLFGNKAGFLALALFLFNPIVLAHGRLVNTDLAITFVFALGIFSFWEMLKKPSWGTVVLAGLAFGLAAVVKFTFIILVPIYIFLLILNYTKNDEAKHNFKKYLLGSLGILAIAYLMILALYYPRLTPPPATESVTQTSSTLRGLNFQSPALDKIYTFVRPVIIPKDYFKGLAMVLIHTGGGQDAYLLGHYSKTGWWYYFPVAFAIKTPLALIVLLIILKIYLIKKKSWQTIDSVFAGSIGIYLLIAMVSKADLGIRHLLPIYPLLAIWIGQLAADKIKFKYKEIIVGGLVTWFLAVAVFAFPNYLSYFSELTGGSKNGYKYLSDSNLDWGQDIIRLKEFMDTNQIEKINLDYTWLSDQAIADYGVNFQRVTPEDKNIHGWVAVGAGKITEYNSLRARATETHQIENTLFVFKID